MTLDEDEMKTCWHACRDAAWYRVEFWFVRACERKRDGDAEAFKGRAEWFDEMEDRWGDDE